MLTRISNYFYDAISPKNIFIPVGVQLLFGFFILPKMNSLIDPLEKTILLDLRIGFSEQKAYEVLEILGEKGRNIYLFTEAFIDILYPVVYSIAFCMLLSLFFQKAFSKNHYLRIFNLFPFLVGFFDILENFGIITMLINFPQKIAGIPQFTSWANLFKWGATLFNLILLFTGIIAWGLMSAIKNKR
jgi:hypothetical protein